MLKQVTPDVPEQRHVWVDEQRNVQVFHDFTAVPRQPSCVLMRGLFELQHQLMSMVVYMGNAPGLKAQMVFCVYHRRFVLIRLHRNYLKRRAANG